MTHVLIGHHLSNPHGDEHPDGGAFICTSYGTARDFGNIEKARDYIEAHLDSRIWKVFLLVEVPE